MIGREKDRSCVPLAISRFSACGLCDVVLGRSIQLLASAAAARTIAW